VLFLQTMLKGIVLEIGDDRDAREDDDRDDDGLDPG
jgi:hypothetical protein